MNVCLDGSCRARGFTLLEMLVVLALVAMVAGVIAPAGSRWLGAARERGWQADLQAELQAQPLRAFHDGRALRLDAGAVRALVPDLPDDLSIELSNLLSYSSAGVASAAEIRLKRPGQATRVWRIVPITGELET